MVFICSILKSVICILVNLIFNIFHENIRNETGDWCLIFLFKKLFHNNSKIKTLFLRIWNRVFETKNECFEITPTNLKNRRESKHFWVFVSNGKSLKAKKIDASDMQKISVVLLPSLERKRFY